MNSVNYRNFITIDVNNCIYNINLTKKLTNSKFVIAVVKANCYGLGVELACKIERYVDILGVATYEEGYLLRNLGIKKPILIFGYVPEEKYSDVITYNLTLSIYSYHFYQSIHSFCKDNNKVITCHLKVDTGMHRFGIDIDEYEVLREILTCPCLKVDGIYSHFARADSDREYSILQKNRFSEVVNFCKNFANFRYIHLSNSYGNNDIFAGNTTRLGYGLYGGFKPYLPILNWQARVVDIHILNKGESIGYGNSYVADSTKKVAVISIGYGDGYPRATSNRYFLYNGIKLPIIGNICMDASFVDVTDININVGDYVTVIGTSQSKTINYDDVGFGYEVLTSIGRRARRIFIE